MKSSFVLVAALLSACTSDSQTAADAGGSGGREEPSAGQGGAAPSSNETGGAAGATGASRGDGSGGQADAGANTASAGAQHANSDTGNASGLGDDCTTTESELDLDEEAPNGLVAQDVLDVVGGAHTTDLVWTEGDVADTTTQITVELEPTGKVRYIASEGEPGTVAYYLNCRDTMVVDVTATIRTEDGALDERAPGVLHVLSSEEAELTVKLDGKALNGTWTLDADPSAKVEATVSATYAKDLLLGTISVIETRSLGNGMGVAGGSARSSYFGSGRCVAGQAEVSLDAESYGLSAEDVLALLNDHEPIALSWKNDETTTVTISVPEAPDYACRTVRGDWCPAGSVNMAASVKLTSEDGRLGSQWDAEVTGVKKADADGLATVRVLFRLEAIPAASFEEQTGLGGVDLTGFDTATLELIGWYDATTEPATPSGTLTVDAQGPCDDEPEVCEDLFDTVELGRLGSGAD